MTPPDASASTGRPRLVVVDDDGALTDALVFSLEMEGFEVLPYPSGEAMLADACPEPPACLVLDLNLPGMNGMELLNRLREQGVRLPAVLVTTHPNAAVRAWARRERLPIVEKPLLTDALLDTVRRAMSSIG